MTIKSRELLRSYIQGVRRLSGAGAVTLFVPATATAFTNAILIHDGELSPVPELADLTTAERFWHSAESELNGSGQATLSQRVLSGSTDCRLVRVPALQPLFLNSLSHDKTDETARSRRKNDVDEPPDPFPVAWIGLRFAGNGGSFPCEAGPLELPPRPSAQDDLRGWWAWLLAVGGSLAWHGQQGAEALDDPVTGLPGRAQLQVTLHQAIDRARTLSWPLTLLLINPDDFGTVNERFGREAGDRILQAIARRLRAVHRSTDPVAKYGGAIFASILIDTPLSDTKVVAEKILHGLAEASFLNGAVRLGFSIGIAGFDPQKNDVRSPLDLIRRADQALNMSKRAGGSRIAIWEDGSNAAEVGNLDRLSGIFTGNMAKDYRNMVLLWDAVTVIAASTDFDGLASQVADRLYSTFKLDRVGVFARVDDGELSLIKGLTRRVWGSGGSERLEGLELSARQWTLVETANRELKPLESTLDEESTGAGAESAKVFACVIPLIARGDCLGCLYLDGHPDAFSTDSSDLILLQALASQTAIALDRARLATLEKQRKEEERRRLTSEVDGLRQALQQAKLVYRSAEEEAVLAVARRVAPTDATVLITGESGTGKELLARTIHELSPRRRKPLVVVDCGTIPSTLIESELFGYEKGAYTGAQQRKVGRLAEADEGTLLLDEIGDLPLELQGRLLRFVQEKQFTPVGGTRTKSVDVRLIAITNRDLAADAAAGRFRQDLYYRLNVVRLVVPPLRERADDILCLANHFLERYAMVYQKDLDRLTLEAEQELLRHTWPGNVRELQNRIMQAVILCKGSELTVELLGLNESTEVALSRSQPSYAAAAGPDRGEGGASKPGTSAPRSESNAGFTRPDSVGEEAVRPTPAVLQERLRVALRRQIQTAVGGDVRLPVPLGKWLGNDLLLEADEAGARIARRGAEIVGIPETTFRRRLRKASEEAKAGLYPRPSSWCEVRDVLAGLVRIEQEGDLNLLAQAEKILLREILSHVPNDARTGSVLLGVTQPTFHRRVARLRS